MRAKVWDAIFVMKYAVSFETLKFLISIFAKRSFLDVWQGFKYVSEKILGIFGMGCNNSKLTLKNFKQWLVTVIRDVCRTLLNIYDGLFLKKQYMAKNRYFWPNRIRRIRGNGRIRGIFQPTQYHLKKCHLRIRKASKAPLKKHNLISSA